MTVVEIMEAIAPELAADSRRDVFITLAASRLTASKFGNLYAQAVAYLAAHLMACAPPTTAEATTGAVVAESTGGMSVTYAAPTAPTGTATDYTSTKYGVEFLNIRNTRAARSARAIDGGV